MSPRGKRLALGTKTRGMLQASLAWIS